MKKLFFILCAVVFLSPNNYSQIQLNNKGEITFIVNTKAKLEDAIINAEALKIKDTQKADNLKKLKKSFEETVNQLTKDINYVNFIKRYTDENTIDNWKAYYLGTTNPVHPMLDKINKATEYNHSFKNKILYRKDIYNASLVDTYNNLYDTKYSTTTPFPLKTSDLLSYSTYITDQLDFLEKYKSLDDNSSFKPEAYAALHNYLLSLISNKTVNEIKSILSSDWVKEWLWIKKGRVSINPFDFTTKEFIAENPRYDETKAKKYNEYINALIEREIASGSIQNFEAFKAILKEKDNGADVFSFKAKNDTLMAKYQKMMKLVSECQFAVNVINPEFLTSGYSIIAATGEVTITGNTDTLSQPRIVKDADRKFAIINFKSDTKLHVDKKINAIADKSTFQVTFDTLASQLGSLATMITNFSPFGVLLETVYKPKNGGLEVAKSNPKKDKIKSINDYNSLIPKADRIIIKTSFSAEKLDTIINDIRKKLAIRLNQSIYDYKNLAEIFCNTIIPPSKIEPTTNDNAPLKTLTLSIATPDKPSESIIKIQYVKKDTTTFKSFSYKTGKQYKYLISAGLALNPFPNKPNQIQSNVEKIDGKIVVTHNVQPFNFFVSFNWYFTKKGLFVQEDKLIRRGKENRRGGRLSAVFGIGITKRPIDNFFVGVAHDLVPGFKINILCKFFRSDDFLLRNDEIIYQKVVYNPALCIGLTIDANSLSKALTNVLKIRGK